MLSGDPAANVARVASLLALVFVVSLAVACESAPPTRAQTPDSIEVPAFSHVFLVVLENKDFEEIFGNPNASYLNGLATEYGIATQYYGVAHPSLPNYLALLGGETFRVTSDCLRCFQAAPSLADQIEATGRTWKAYFESMPSACYAGDSPRTGYVQKHNPFFYFNAIREDPARCGRIVPLGELAVDLDSGQVPDLTWIGPNLRNSMHDAPANIGDRWLASMLPSVLESPAFLDDGLLVVTFDEGNTDAGCCGHSPGGGRTMTVVASPLGRHAFTSDLPHNHYSLLRTIEDAWGLERLGHAADPSTSNLAEFFVAPGQS